MDVRDLAPALMAVGQLMDAANAAIYGEGSIKLQVRATERGSFQITLELIQSLPHTIWRFMGSADGSAATNLLSWVLGVPALGAGSATSLLWLIKTLKGRSPERVEKLPDNTIRLIIGEDTLILPLELLRLYQDVAVRNAVQKLVEEPLKNEGIDTFLVKKDGEVTETVSREESYYFSRPVLADETLIDEVRRSAFSIVSLAFKEDNKWRLYDGNTQINATIADPDFLERVDTNQVSFSKGDILLCDVRVMQRRSSEGLKTDYVVEKVVEHRPAARQIPLQFRATDL